VVALLVTGLFNPGFLASLASLYGRVLLAKIGIFGCMLMLAAANRFWLTPRLGADMQAGGGSRAPVRMLQASVVTETMLGLLALLAVAWLGTLQPPP